MSYYKNKINVVKDIQNNLLLLSRSMSPPIIREFGFQCIKGMQSIDKTQDSNPSAIDIAARSINASHNKELTKGDDIYDLFLNKHNIKDSKIVKNAKEHLIMIPTPPRCTLDRFYISNPINRRIFKVNGARYYRSPIRPAFWPDQIYYSGLIPLLPPPWFRVFYPGYIWPTPSRFFTFRPRVVRPVYRFRRPFRRSIFGPFGFRRLVGDIERRNLMNNNRRRGRRNRTRRPRRRRRTSNRRRRISNDVKKSIAKTPRQKVILIDYAEDSKTYYLKYDLSKAREIKLEDNRGYAVKCSKTLPKMSFLVSRVNSKGVLEKNIGVMRPGKKFIIGDGNSSGCYWCFRRPITNALLLKIKS